MKRQTNENLRARQAEGRNAIFFYTVCRYSTILNVWGDPEAESVAPGSGDTKPGVSVGLKCLRSGC